MTDYTKMTVDELSRELADSWEGDGEVHAAARLELARRAREADALRAERDALRHVVKTAHGALYDCTSVPVPGSLYDVLGPAIRHLRDERDDACRERDQLKSTLLERHGGEPLALLAELDKACEERDEARADLAKYEDVMRKLDFFLYDRPAGKGICVHAADKIEELRAALAKSEAEVARLRGTLEVLARLGNGGRYGNSEGNMIARQALAQNSPQPAAEPAPDRIAEPQEQRDEGAGISGVVAVPRTRKVIFSGHPVGDHESRIAALESAVAALREETTMLDQRTIGDIKFGGQP